MRACRGCVGSRLRSPSFEADEVELARIGQRLDFNIPQR
jgi:hypothetical protein